MFCFDIETMTYIRLGLYAAGIYICYVSWGVLQERISSTQYGAELHYFRSFVVLNILQSIVCCLWACGYYVYHRIFVKSKHLRISLFHRDPALWWRCLQIALINAIASPFGYHSLKYISYPIMILAKSCKLVPVMVIGIVFFRQKYETYKYMSVTLITMGVSLFMLYSGQSPKSLSSVANNVSFGDYMIGFLFVAMNLLLDGLTNASQDDLFMHYRVSGPEMMFYMNFLGVFWMLFYLILWPWQTEWRDAVNLFLSDLTCVRDIILFTLFGALGQTFVYATLQYFGALTLVTITVTRKLVTILLSVALFRHEINLYQWFAIALVFVGISTEAYAKEPRSELKNKKIT
jgi:UDP-galactose transporter B1